MWKFLQFVNRDFTIAEWLYYLSSVYLCYVSFVNVTFLSVDRFLALHLHLRYKEFVTVKRTVFVVVVVWVMGAFTTGSWNGLLQYNDVLRIINASLVFAGQVLDITLYYKIYVIVRHHRRQIDSQILRWVNTEGRNFYRSRRSFVSIFHLYLLFLACSFPYTVMLGLRSKIHRSIYWVLVYTYFLKFCFKHAVDFSENSRNSCSCRKHCGESKATVVMRIER